MCVCVRSQAHARKRTAMKKKKHMCVTQDIKRRHADTQAEEGTHQRGPQTAAACTLRWKTRRGTAAQTGDNSEEKMMGENSGFMIETKRQQTRQQYHTHTHPHTPTHTPTHTHTHTHTQITSHAHTHHQPSFGFALTAWLSWSATAGHHHCCRHHHHHHHHHFHHCRSRHRRWYCRATRLHRDRGRL